MPNTIRLHRVLRATPDRIYRAFLDADAMAKWLPPHGFTGKVHHLDARVGGTRQICMEMQTPGGPMQMWFTGEHREVVENQRLVYTEMVSDEDGNPASPETMGLPDGHSVTEVRVELDVVDGRTRMIMTHQGIPAGSPGAAGWAMAFDKLAALIAGQ